MREPLPPDVETLLEAERGAAPAKEAMPRVARRLELSLGVALGVTASAATASAATTSVASTASSAASASAATAVKTLALKLLLGAVGAALVGGGTYVALHKNSAPPRVIASRHLEETAPRRTIPAPIIPSIPPVTPTPHAAHARPRPDAFASEQAFLEEARAALVGGAPERAVKLLGEERRRFPSSPLTETRESLLVQALAATGRVTDARAQAADFRHRFPHSLYQPAVDASLDGR
jgi:hypothetical protein